MGGTMLFIRQWKLRPMEVESRRRWYEMFNVRC
jgi:polyphosphate kinase 2 (PPK2 family)